MSVTTDTIKKKEGIKKFVIGERYRVFNEVSENHGNYLTIININKDLIYYLFDGSDQVQCFSSSSEFAVDLIKLV